MQTREDKLPSFGSNIQGAGVGCYYPNWGWQHLDSEQKHMNHYLMENQFLPELNQSILFGMAPFVDSLWVN